MSELKWNWVYYPYLDSPNKQEESALKAGYVKVVSKDDADKVIAEKDTVIANKDYEIDKLKKSIGKLLKAKTEQVIDEVLQKCLIYGEGFVPVEHAMRIIAELRHQKYKRCLAMAKYCKEATYYFEERLDKCSTYWRVSVKKDFYERWHKRWMELADEFKEGK